MERLMDDLAWLKDDVIACRNALRTESDTSVKVELLNRIAMNQEEIRHLENRLKKAEKRKSRKEGSDV